MALQLHLPPVKSMPPMPPRTFDEFWRKYFYKRIEKCWGRVLRSRAGGWVRVKRDPDETSKERFGRPMPLVSRDGSIHESEALIAKKKQMDPDDGLNPIFSYEDYDLRLKTDLSTLPHPPLDPSQHFRPHPSRSIRALNFGSYNYLGFADPPPAIVKRDTAVIRQLGVVSSSPTLHTGTTPSHINMNTHILSLLHQQGEEAAHNYSCFSFSMGYATNTCGIPALCSPKSLIISDSLNHASIVLGCLISGAKIRIYMHGNYEELEHILRQEIVGPDGKGCRYANILIICEGIYSMEGDVSDVKQLVELSHKYKAFLYIDEAHSVGAMGRNGGGVCEYWDEKAGMTHSRRDVGSMKDNEFSKRPLECMKHSDVQLCSMGVDVLMGTYTKSFASIGGYICSNYNIIEKINETGGGWGPWISGIKWGGEYSSDTEIFDNDIGGMSLPPFAAEQIDAVLDVLDGRMEECEHETEMERSQCTFCRSGAGGQRFERLAENTRYFRQELLKLGFTILGNDDSPVVPLVVYHPLKMSYLSEELLRRHIAIVLVGFPAVPVIENRVRFCISSAHSRADIDYVLAHLAQLGAVLGLRKAPKQPHDKRVPLHRISIRTLTNSLSSRTKTGATMSEACIQTDRRESEHMSQEDDSISDIVMSEELDSDGENNSSSETSQRLDDKE